LAHEQLNLAGDDDGQEGPNAGLRTEGPEELEVAVANDPVLARVFFAGPGDDLLVEVQVRFDRSLAAFRVSVSDCQRMRKILPIFIT